MVPIPDTILQGFTCITLPRKVFIIQTQVLWVLQLVSGYLPQLYFHVVRTLYCEQQHRVYDCNASGKNTGDTAWASVITRTLLVASKLYGVYGPYLGYIDANTMPPAEVARALLRLGLPWQNWRDIDVAYSYQQ